MVAIMFTSVALIAMLCVPAYALAVYALPFMLGLTAAQFVYQTGSGLTGSDQRPPFGAGCRRMSAGARPERMSI
jgi:hypothetical protein